MLTSLDIRDVVLIDRLSLDFDKGLSVLTGETGAGKSILLDALGLALGARGDTALVRHGATQAMVTAHFELPAPHPLHDLLETQGIPKEGNTLTFRRILGADGRSKAFLNEEPVGVTLLRKAGDLLVEVHGQFENHGLLDIATHRNLLDDWGEHAALLDTVSANFATWKTHEKRLTDLTSEAQRIRAEEDWLRHALGEIEAMAPEAGEENLLSEERSRLLNASRISEAITAVRTALENDDPMHAARRALSRAESFAPNLISPIQQALDRMDAEAQEARALIQDAERNMEDDPQRLPQLEDRLFALRALARKHNIPIDELPGLQTTLAERLSLIDDHDGAIARLHKDVATARHSYHAAADILHVAREKAGHVLDEAVGAELSPLKLGKARFHTTIAPLPESSWGPHGLDEVTFKVAANPGQDPSPLHKTASGGELARLMLAIKVVLAKAGDTPVLVFDEVDSGIGGSAAAAVGQRLARLGETHPVLVVTHSPQVAARGMQHFLVRKSEGAAGTILTGVVRLDDVERHEEIARMLSGEKTTDAARAAAASLLAGAPADV